MDPGEIDPPYTGWQDGKELSFTNGPGLDPLAVRQFHNVLIIAAGNIHHMEYMFL